MCSLLSAWRRCDHCLKKRLSKSSVCFWRTDSVTFVQDVTRGRQHKWGTPDTKNPQGKENKHHFKQASLEGRKATDAAEWLFSISAVSQTLGGINKQFNYSPFLPASVKSATPLVSNSSSYCRLTMIPALRSLLLAAEQMMRPLQSNWVSAAMSYFFSLSPLQTKTRPKSSMNANPRGHCVRI